MRTPLDTAQRGKHPLSPAWADFDAFQPLKINGDVGAYRKRTGIGDCLHRENGQVFIYSQPDRHVMNWLTGRNAIPEFIRDFVGLYVRDMPLNIELTVIPTKALTDHAARMGFSARCRA